MSSSNQESEIEMKDVDDVIFSKLVCESTTIVAENIIGMVKWFNNKSGFGFITVCSPCEHKGKDIFVHFSSISITKTQYKYLIQGEYVDMTIVKVNSDKHEFQAANISGVLGGPIMCETRNLNLHTSSSSRQDMGNNTHSSCDNRRGDSTQPQKRSRVSMNCPSIYVPMVLENLMDDNEDIDGFKTVKRNRSVRTMSRHLPPLSSP